MIDDKRVNHISNPSIEFQSSVVMVAEESAASFMKKVVMRVVSTFNVHLYRLCGGKWMRRFSSGAASVC
jgi:hypothetical protein